MHALPGVQVPAVPDGGREVAHDQPDRRLHQGVPQGIAALIDGNLSFRDFKMGAVGGHEGFHGVGEGVDPAVRRGLGRTGHGHERVHHRCPGSQVVAGDRHLDVVLGVGQDSRMGDFGTCPGRRRHGDQRQDGARNPAFTHVVPGFASVGEQDTDGLGQVHVAAASKAHQQVRFLPGGEVVAAEQGRNGRLRLPAVKEGDPHTSGSQSGLHLVGQTGFHQSLVGHHQGVAGSQFPSNLTQLIGGAPAKVNGPGSMKTPCGPHAGLPPHEPRQIDENQGKV